jgi:hypothetical protein
MKITVSWGVTPCGSCKNVVSNSPILVTLMMEELRSYATRFLHEPRGITSQDTAFYTSLSVGGLSSHMRPAQ